MSLLSPSSSSAYPPAAGVQLYRHALESVFGFLSLRELHSALSVSKSWLAAVSSMRSLGASISPLALPVSVTGFSGVARHREAALTLEAMRVSPLARHVTTIGTEESGVEVSSEWLALASQRLRGLHTLHLGSMPSLPEEGSIAAGMASLILPPTLTCLSVRSRARSMGAYAFRNAPVSPTFTAEINSFLEVAGRLPWLRSFTLHLGRADLSAGVCFKHLHAASKLEHLQLNWYPLELHGDQFDDLRGLTRLAHLQLEFPKADTIQRLIQQPHALQWKEIVSFECTLSAEQCALMPSLPSLTSLRGALRGALNFSFLHRLPNLIRLRLDVAGCFLPGDDLVAALRMCARVTELHLAFCKLDSQQMCTLLPGLPILQHFTLEGERSLESLRCFSAGPICSTLTHLTLIDCKHAKMHPSELDHLHALKALTHLHVLMPFTSPPSALQRQQFTPPSAVLPKLIEFKYERRF